MEQVVHDNDMMMISDAASPPAIVEDDDPITETQSVREEGRKSPLSSVFGEVTVFRDFFLAAFSDGYSRICCAEEGFFPGVEESCISSKRAAPDDDLRRNSSHCSNKVSKSPSCDGLRKKRKKPLAVAVGYNYANDVDGRPIVVTPGGRYSPRGQSGERGSPLRRGQSTDLPSPPRMPSLASQGEEEGLRAPMSLSYRSKAY